MAFIFVDREYDEMARTNRRDGLADGEIQSVYFMNRRVGRTFLCGQDARRVQ